MRIDHVYTVLRVSQTVHAGLHVHALIEHERVVQVSQGVPVLNGAKVVPRGIGLSENHSLGGQSSEFV